MQALAERLDTALAGRVLAAVEPMQFSALKTVAPGPEELVGRRVERIGRRGKYLIFEFEGPRLVLHLSQAGRVRLEEQPKRTRPRNGVVRLRFEAAPDVLVIEYGTERKAAWWLLAAGDERPLAELGPEADSEEFARLVREGDDRRRLHTLLRDQRTVAGIGRGYADDILHEARLSPFASLESLESEERERLLAAVETVLRRGLEHERAREGGLPDKLGDHWIVHGRHGKPCPRCSRPLERVSYESYEIAYCPDCQTGGRVLADRRLSRLLR